MSGWMGVDLSQYDLDEPIGNVKSNAIQSVVANYQRANEDGGEWTVRDIGRLGAIGGLGPFIVGSGAEIADQLQEWVEETDVDGFNLAYAITPGTFEDVVEFVIPELRKRGAYPEEYAPGSLRNKLHGAGDRLPENHRGSAVPHRHDGRRDRLTGRTGARPPVLPVGVRASDGQFPQGGAWASKVRASRGVRMRG